MARIRTIKPEFPQSEKIGVLSRDARLLFVQLWTVVDDEGRTRAASRMLASLLYPYDDDAPALIGDWMDELEAKGHIRRYVVDGSQYLDIPNWLKHQKIDRPTPSRLPAYSDELASPREPSRSIDADLGPRTMDQEGTMDRIRAVAKATRPDAEKIFDERFWPEYPKRGDAANPKKPAKDKFVRLVKDGIDPEVMISAAKRFCQIEREAGRHGTDKVAQAITWLNQQRFSDYAEIAPAKPTGPPAGLPSDEELRRKYGAMDDEGQTGPRGSVEGLACEDQEPGSAPVLRAGAGVHPPERGGGLRAGGRHRGAQGVGQILRGLGLGAGDLQRNAAGGEGRGEAFDDGPEPVA
jgi:hypothetical protein